VFLYQTDLRREGSTISPNRIKFQINCDHPNRKLQAYKKFPKQPPLPLNLSSIILPGSEFHQSRFTAFRFLALSR